MTTPTFPTTAKILLDDGTGTYPYDVTQYVRQVDGVQWTRGRPDELSDNAAGSCTVVFDNTDGRFTFGSVTYNIACDQGIRFQLEGVNRFTGRVQSWPVSWPDGSDQFSVVTANATDELAPLTRRVLNTSAIEEVVVDTFNVTVGGVQQFGVWPLSDDPGTALVPFAHDVLGTAPPLDTTGVSGISPQFGQTLGTPDGANGVLITCGTTFNNIGDGLSPVTISPMWDVFASMHFEITYNLHGAFTTGLIDLISSAEGPNQAFTIALSANQISIKRGALDTPYQVSTPGPSNSYAGGPHTIVFDSTNSTSRLWFDGVLIDSRAGFNTNYNFLQSWQVCTGFIDSGGMTGITIGNLVVGPSITSAARIVSHQTAALTDFKSETPAARITRLAGYVGVPTGTIDSAGDTTCGIASQQNRTAMDCIQEAADADQGNVYIDKAGNLVYTSGTSIAGLTDATFDANWTGADTQFVADMQSIVNYATGQIEDGTTAGAVSDLTSITAHGRYPQAYAWNVDTYNQGLWRTQWKVAKYSEPTPRCPTLTLDLLSMDSTNRANAMTVDLDTILQITGLPSQTPGGTSQAFLVVGITETVSSTEWSLQLNCVQRSLIGAWILADTTYGVLGSTTTLYI